MRNTQSKKRSSKGRSTSVRIVKLKMVNEGAAQYRAPVATARGVVEMVKPMLKDSYREEVLVIGLSSANVPNVIHTVGSGGPNQSPVVVGNVFKPLLLSNSTGFILVHNHPGSTLSPSSADRTITRRVKEAGEMLEIPMLDHVIVNADCSKFVSLRTEGGI